MFLSFNQQPTKAQNKNNDNKKPLQVTQTSLCTHSIFGKNYLSLNYFVYILNGCTDFQYLIGMLGL